MSTASTAVVTVITPTTGRPSLDRLVASVDAQAGSAAVFHLLLWDDHREPEARTPSSYEAAHRLSLVLPPGSGRNGDAPGSALRAIGLMVARTPWVTFADDDVHWEADHLQRLLSAAEGRHWASTLRHVWTPSGDYLGVDRFESVGDDPGRRVPYEMVDNNCMMFRREFGTMAAVLYRETAEYNDDRLMYGALKQHAGPRGSTSAPTIHQACPDRLVDFFRTYCAPR